MAFITLADNVMLKKNRSWLNGFGESIGMFRGKYVQRIHGVSADVRGPTAQ